MANYEVEVDVVVIATKHVLPSNKDFSTMPEGVFEQAEND